MVWLYDLIFLILFFNINVSTEGQDRYGIGSGMSVRGGACDLSQLIVVDVTYNAALSGTSSSGRSR